MPSQKTPLHDKFGYASHHKVLPAYDADKVNCTVTVRVPRYYLSGEQREMITRTRYLWGTGVYSDDSDPIAAAIHEGWIRGEWDEDEETVNELIGLGPLNKADFSSEDAIKDALRLEEPPEKGPVVPPVGFDLHITLLVLPKLEKYASTVQFGIRSSSWGNNHDGMSFKILRCEFVDEGSTRTLERTAKARRDRLRAEAAMGLMSLFASGGDSGVGGVANGRQGQMIDRADGGRIGVVGA